MSVKRLSSLIGTKTSLLPVTSLSPVISHSIASQATMLAFRPAPSFKINLINKGTASAVSSLLETFEIINGLGTDWEYELGLCENKISCTTVS